MPRVTDDAMRHLLLLTYWYPPTVGAAAERMGAFARYLPEFGWRVHVLCAGNSTGGSEQDGGENLQITRVADPLASAGSAFADYDPRQPGAPGWKRFLKRFVFPDRFDRWRKSAAMEAKKLTSEIHFDAILASFPPASVVNLALDVRKMAAAPLVLDFRDRWLGPGGYEPTTESLRERHRRLEREAVTTAAAITAVSENMADAIATENDILRSRVHVVPNGYEPVSDDFDRAGTAETRRTAGEGVLTIAHVGTVIPRNRPDLFFDSLRKCTADPRFNGIRFRFVGNLSRDFVRSIDLEGSVETTGLVSRDAARREMRDADALLLLVGDYVGRWGHNAKLFEYVQSGRPILCLEESEGSNDRKLLERFVPDRAFIAPLGDVDALVGAIEGLRAYITLRPTAAIELAEAFRDYSRKRQTETLAGILASVSAK